jgi:two-component system, OmpR family, phosphate regulon sensor histidine kinase PhoR
MARQRSRGMTPGRLRLALGLLFVALAVPSAVLILQTQRQLKWEALHRQRELATELAERIDRQLQRLVAAEDARGSADYGFLTGPADAALLQRSPLSQLPPPVDWPGLLGWFQIDPAGRFSTPLLPEPQAGALGLDADELRTRQAQHERLLDVLAENRLAQRRRGAESLQRAASEDEDRIDATSAQAVLREDSRPLAAEADAMPAPTSIAEVAAPAPAAQVAFDRLNKAEQGAGRTSEGFAASRQSASPPAPPSMPASETPTLRARRSEPAKQMAAEDARTAPLRIFESELDPLEFARLDSGHFVLFRRVWRNGERSIQGLLIEPQAFLRGAVADAFDGSLLAASADLAIAWQGETVERVPGRAARRYPPGDDALQGTLLYRARLSAPLSGLELLWTLRRLPAAPGATQLAWSGALLFGVLLAATLMLYRLGLRQIRLAGQQQDFIAAVSHELKTPLTSIRMYGELLRAGWAPEERRREYYDFIHDEAERLSRLIANVLQLARLERDGLQFDLRPYPVATLFDLVRSKVQAQIERAGFESEFRVDPACAEREAMADADALVQIMINLVDNALKFSARAARRRLEITVTCSGGRLRFAVRDYGPGVPPALRRRVFELFFRGGNELTRETRGTGIGLALVRQLANGMHGDVELLAGEPGAEFRLWLPLSRGEGGAAPS